MTPSASPKIGMAHSVDFHGHTNVPSFVFPLVLHHFQIHCDSSDTIPTLQELQTLQCNNMQIKIIESIASEWESVAIALSIGMDRIRIIRTDSHGMGVEEACRRMLEWWLHSMGDRATWRRLVRAVKDSKSDFLVLACDIEKALE